MREIWTALRRSRGGKFNFVNGDIQDFASVKKVFEGVDIAVHFAAETHVDRSLGRARCGKAFLPHQLRRDHNLITCGAGSGRQAFSPRFHRRSVRRPRIRLAEKFHEKFPYNAHNPYAISKAAADFAVRGFARSHGLPVTISNCTNNYGPFQTPEKVIPRSISLLLKNEKIQLYTDANGIPGPNVRDWLHVDDHCRAIENIILDGKIGETYASAATAN